jgi:hypothetical protein
MEETEEGMTPEEGEAAPTPARQPAPPPATYTAPSTSPPPAQTPAEASAPQATMIEVPAGTILEAELLTPLSTETNNVGDGFAAEIFEPVVIGNRVVIPAGTRVRGEVTETVSAKKMRGQAAIVLQFNKLKLPNEDVVRITAILSEKGKKIGKRTAGIVGGSTGGGAILGKIIGKDTKSALIGAAAGAAIGTGIAATREGQELELPRGTGMAFELTEPAQVQVYPEGA